MANTDDNTILLYVGDDTARLEKINAAATITPGMLLKYNSDFEWVPHNTGVEYAVVGKYFAYEDIYVGDPMTHSYTIGNRVFVVSARPGDQILAFIEDDTCAPGDYMVSVANGHLQVHSGTPPVDQRNIYVGVAMEAVSSPGAVSRVAIEIC